MTRVLITGSSGFIGRSLKGYIEKKSLDIEVYGIDIAGPGNKKDYFRIDINNTSSIKRIIKKLRPDYIFHLAGLKQSKNLQSLITSNVVTTRSLLEALFHFRKLFSPRVIVVGSAAEYGNVLPKDMPVKENHPLRPINFYGLSKKYQTELALSYFRKGIDVIVARIFNITGHGSPRTLSCGEFSYQISLIEEGKISPLVKVRDLGSKRDYVDIKDVCSALMGLSQKANLGQVYNICSGTAYATKYILDSLIGFSELKGIKVKTVGADSSEIKSIVGSNEKIRRHTGWKQLVSIEESLKETLNYYRKG